MSYVNLDRAKFDEEKREIIERLMRLWLEYPDMRLTQLIENARGGDHGTLSNDRSVFYNEEDYPFIDKLEEFYANL